MQRRGTRRVASIAISSSANKPLENANLAVCSSTMNANQTWNQEMESGQNETHEIAQIDACCNAMKRAIKDNMSPTHAKAYPGSPQGHSKRRHVAAPQECEREKNHRQNKHE
jgi:hypothetical protein